MIDTIVLTIPREYFSIFEGDKFSPPVTKEVKDQAFGRSGYQKYVLNPTRNDSKAGIYLPRLTYIRRLVPYSINEILKIEFSAPKMLFLNNFDEIEENDFGLLKSAILNSLISMGVYLKPDYLPLAPVSTIHFCKNIPFTDYTSANMVIKNLSRIDVPKSSDFNHRHFMNCGQALYIHNGTHQFVIYDKIRDSSMPHGRGIETNDIQFQQSLFDGKKPLEIVRLEVRLTHRQKITSILGKIGQNTTQSTFKDLFSKDISQKVLVYYWKTYFKDIKYNFAYRKESEPEKLLNQILTNVPNIKCNHALALLGATLFAQTSGIRPLKTTIQKRFAPETWYRISKSFTELSNMTKDQSENAYISTIEKELENFRPFKLRGYK